MTPRPYTLAPGESPYLTVREVAVWLRLSSPDRVYYLINQRGLPFRRCGHKYLFRKDEVDAWSAGYDSTLDAQRALRRA